MSEGSTIESVLQEERVFDPPANLARDARISGMESYRALAEAAKSDPDAFWGEAARRELHWFEPFHTVLDWNNPPFARWFEGGTTNLSYNCLDRHLNGPKANKTALIWEGEPGDVRTFTYQELHAEVCRAANALQAIGTSKSNRYALYMPLVPNDAIRNLPFQGIGPTYPIGYEGVAAKAFLYWLNDSDLLVVITVVVVLP